MGISMVAALLMIPSDILRACKDTDALLEPGDQAETETTLCGWGPGASPSQGNPRLPRPGAHGAKAWDELPMAREQAEDSRQLDPCWQPHAPSSLCGHCTARHSLGTRRPGPARSLLAPRTLLAELHVPEKPAPALAHGTGAWLARSLPPLQPTARTFWRRDGSPPALTALRGAAAVRLSQLGGRPCSGTTGALQQTSSWPRAREKGAKSHVGKPGRAPEGGAAARAPLRPDRSKHIPGQVTPGTPAAPLAACPGGAAAPTAAGPPGEGPALPGGDEACVPTTRLPPTPAAPAAGERPPQRPPHPGTGARRRAHGRRRGRRSPKGSPLRDGGQPRERPAPGDPPYPAGRAYLPGHPPALPGTRRPRFLHRCPRPGPPPAAREPRSASARDAPEAASPPPAGAAGRRAGRSVTGGRWRRAEAGRKSPSRPEAPPRSPGGPGWRGPAEGGRAGQTHPSPPRAWSQAPSTSSSSAA